MPRTRETVAAPAIDLENRITRPLSKPLLLQRRPALGELGNKVEVNKHLTEKVPVEQKKAPTAKNPPKPKIVDPDVDTKDEPQMVTEYLPEIFTHLRHMEDKFPVQDKFLEKHLSTPRMRSILVNWLVQVHTNFKLCLETLHLCVSITDRYLQINKQIGKDTLQLVGVTALFIACKYEEMYLPDLTDFVFICDETYTKRQILKMEQHLLKKLDFSLGRPVSISFLRRFSKVGKVKIDQHNAAKYLLELALLDYNMVHIKPSVQAAAACCLSIALLSDGVCPSVVWTPTMEHYTTYTYADFKDVVVHFARLLAEAKASKHQAIQTKYATSNYNCISLSPELNGHLVKRLLNLRTANGAVKPVATLVKDKGAAEL